MSGSTVNGDSDDRLLEISSYRRTSTSCRFLGTKRSTFKSHRGVFYLARCGHGESRVAVFDGIWTEDERGNPDGLAEYEVTVEAPPPPPPAGPEATEFNIELVFMDEGVFDAREEGWIRDAADRWEKIITGDIEDHSFVDSPATFEASWGAQITVGDVVDDIRIFVGVTNDPDDGLAWAGPSYYRVDTYQPILSTMTFNEAHFDYLDDNRWYGTSLHEIAHCLGFIDFFWQPERLDLLRLPSGNNGDADSHFNGNKAIAAFNQAGGWNYQGNKVPLENGGDDSHWRYFVLHDEVMNPYSGRGQYLSAITVAVFDHMGYEVEYSQADIYRLPRQAAKPVAELPHVPHGWHRGPDPIGLGP